MRYRLRTLLILLAVGPPVLAWVWFHSVPLAIVLSVCLIGTVLGRTLLWGIEGLLAVASFLIADLRHATRPKQLPNPDDADEFSLSSFASKVKARRKE